jgi:hypothetical protein
MNRKALLSGGVAAGLALVGLLAPVVAPAEPPVQPAPAAPDAAFDTLRRIDAFALGGVGFAGTTSEGEKALRDVLARKDAVAVLERLSREATPAGRLYALVGLRWQAAPSYATAATDLLNREKETVQTISGCIISQSTVADIAKRIDTGQYDGKKDSEPHNTDAR